VSSAGESRFALEDPSPNRIAFDLERVMRTEYEIDRFQKTYFVIESYKQLFDATQRDFAPIYDRLKSKTHSYKTDETISSDKPLGAITSLSS